jgi:hypothetical protein
VKRTRATRASAATVENRTEGPTSRGRATKTAAEAKPEAKPARRSSSRVKSSTIDDSKSDELATKKGGTKRSSKEAVETKATHSVKRAKTEAAAKQPKAKSAPSKPTRRSTRISRDKSSDKPFVVAEVPIVQAPPQHLIPADFGLTRDDSAEKDFTYGIAYYDEKDRDDTLLCKDYVTDMFQNMFEAEVSDLFVVLTAIQNSVLLAVDTV